MAPRTIQKSSKSYPKEIKNHKDPNKNLGCFRYNTETKTAVLDTKGGKPK